MNLCFGTLLAQDDFEAYFKFIEKKNNEDFEMLQNPFVNPTFEKLRQIKIAAVMFNRVKIDDQWYEKGDKIGDAVISEINTKEIEFKYDNLEILIQLLRNDKININ